MALKELIHGKVRFGLIVLATSLVVSLTMLMSAMSEGLVTGMTGAKGSLDADALVFESDSRLTLERSFLNPAAMEEIRRAPAVTEAYGVGHVAVSINDSNGRPDESIDARVFGLEGRWSQLPRVEGTVKSPSLGGVVADVAARAEGFQIGDTIHVSPGDRELELVGFTENRRYIMAPAFYVSMETWEDLYLASVLGSNGTSAGDGNPADEIGSTIGGRVEGAASVAAVLLEDGASVSELTRSLGDAFEVATPTDAAFAANGMEAMVLAVDGIQLVSLLIGALVIGVFFYITTLHKSTQIAALKALGASNRHLYIQLLLQIGVLVTGAIVVGIVLALGAGASMPPTMAFDPRPSGWVLTIAAVYAMAVIGSLFSLRSILRIDPAAALDAGGH